MNTTSIQTQSTIPRNDNLKSAGHWANFIGIVFLVMAILVLAINIFVFTNLNEIANQFMHLNGMSEQSLNFIHGAGKWLFTFIMLIIAAVMGINSFFLIRFYRKSNKFYISEVEQDLQQCLHSLSQYLFISTILGIFSMIITLMAILFYMSIE